MNIKNRVAKLEELYVGGTITVTLRGGGSARIPAREILDIFLDVVDGRDTAHTRIVLAAEASDEEGRMIELMQALHSGPIM
jgi:hypothetical protein